MVRAGGEVAASSPARLTPAKPRYANTSAYEYLGVSPALVLRAGTARRILVVQLYLLRAIVI